jgi:hypothetical protein
MNKNRMVIVRRVFNSEDFLVYPLLSQMHLMQQSNYSLKAMANWSMPMFWLTPSQIFLKHSRIKTSPASTSFTPQNIKRPQELDPANRGRLKQQDLVGGHPHRNDVGCGDQNFWFSERTIP